MATSKAELDFLKLRKMGVTLPTHPGRARLAVNNLVRMASDTGGLQQDVQNIANITRGTLSSHNSRLFLPDEAKGMRKSAGMGTADTRLAWPKQRDPFQWWQEHLSWFQAGDSSVGGTADTGLSRIRDWCRLLYTTHHLVPSLIDIYTRFPLLDIELKHKDTKLAQFYQELFFDQLDYEEFLFDAGREFWVTGESFSLGSWNETIGAWEDDELINPQDVKVTRNRALRSHEFYISVPQELLKLIETKEPREEYQALVQLYPDLIEFARQKADIPVSDTLMSHAKFKTDPWNPRGTPILLRAFRSLMLEESLNSTQDSIADRLYSPLLLATLGLDNIDDQGPWIPTPTELSSMRDDLQTALNADFRLMTYHHGLKIQSVFGRESMPNLSSDLDRCDKKVMQIFGIGREMLEGGKSGVAYASGALNRELITQMLSTYQVIQRKHMEKRMRVVAERQGHFEYEKKGEMRIPIMERVLVINEETGEEEIREMPKLAIPKVNFKAMNLRDEKTERDFLFALRDKGWPISDQSLAVNIPIEFDEESSRVKEEKIRKVILEAQFKKELFERLTRQKLPIPVEYQQEYEAWKKAEEGGEAQPGEEGAQSKAFKDITSPAIAPNMSPDSGDGEAGTESPGEDDQAVQEPEGVPQRPEESDSMRGASIVEKPFRDTLHMSRFGSKSLTGKEVGVSSFRVLMKIPKYTSIRETEDEPQFEDSLDEQEGADDE